MLSLLFALLYFEYIQIELIVGGILRCRRAMRPLLLVLQELSYSDGVIRRVRLLGLSSVALANHSNAIR